MGERGYVECECGSGKTVCVNCANATVARLRTENWVMSVNSSKREKELKRELGLLQNRLRAGIKKLRGKLTLKTQEVAAVKSSVVHALGAARDYEGLSASTLNYLQCIRRLVSRLPEVESVCKHEWVCCECGSERLFQQPELPDDDPNAEQHGTMPCQVCDYEMYHFVEVVEKCEEEVSDE